MFKKHELYFLYEHYIESKNISTGAKKLMKISESSFKNFIFQYGNNLNFKKIIDDLVKTEIRDIKINDILDDDIFRTDRS
jgi:hypothetical protein